MTEKHLLWEVAIRDAAEILGAYYVPSGLNIAAVNVRSHGTAPAFDFALDLQRRLDLGRSTRFTTLFNFLDNSLTELYRTTRDVMVGSIPGTLDVPRYIRCKVKGDVGVFPIRRTTRSIHTPENLLISEAFRLSISTCTSFQRHRSGEGEHAGRVLKDLSTSEARYPWRELRHVPRHSMADLIVSVRSRAKHGIIPQSHPAMAVCDLFDPPHPGRVFEFAASTLALAIVDDAAFADKMYELLCVAWIIAGFKCVCGDKSRIFPIGSARGIVFSGEVDRTLITVYFQRNAAIGPATWKERKSKRSLRALPDVTIVASNGNVQVVQIVDAKNRSIGGRSEIVYKLLGYKENLTLEPFRASAVLPNAGRQMTHRTYNKGHNSVSVLQIPLDRSQRAFRLVVRHFVRSLENSGDGASTP